MLRSAIPAVMAASTGRSQSRWREVRDPGRRDLSSPQHRRPPRSVASTPAAGAGVDDRGLSGRRGADLGEVGSLSGSVLDVPLQLDPRDRPPRDRDAWVDRPDRARPNVFVDCSPVRLAGAAAQFEERGRFVDGEDLAVDGRRASTVSVVFTLERRGCAAAPPLLRYGTLPCLHGVGLRGATEPGTSRW